MTVGTHQNALGEFRPDLLDRPSLQQLPLRVFIGRVQMVEVQRPMIPAVTTQATLAAHPLDRLEPVLGVALGLFLGMALDALRVFDAVPVPCKVLRVVLAAPRTVKGFRTPARTLAACGLEAELPHVTANGRLADADFGGDLTLG